MVSISPSLRLEPVWDVLFVAVLFRVSVLICSDGDFCESRLGKEGGLTTEGGCRVVVRMPTPSPSF